MINKELLPEELHGCFDYVNKWCKRNGVDLLHTSKTGAVWANDYEEYDLFLNDLCVPMLKCTSVEIIRSVVFLFCVPNVEEKFLRTINALNDYQ